MRAVLHPDGTFSIALEVGTPKGPSRSSPGAANSAHLSKHRRLAGELWLSRGWADSPVSCAHHALLVCRRRVTTSSGNMRFALPSLSGEYGTE